MRIAVITALIAISVSAAANAAGQGSGKRQNMQEQSDIINSDTINSERQRKINEENRLREERMEKQRERNQTNMPMSDSDLRRQLEEQRYSVRRFRREGDKLEAEALRDGERWRLRLDPNTGRILERKAD